MGTPSPPTPSPAPTTPANPTTRAARAVHRRQGALLAREDGFTLLELLMVLVIVGVLLAIAVPSYLGFKERAARRAAAADVRSAVPSLESYYSDVGTYAGATPAGLRASYDAGLAAIVLSGLSTDAYVVARTVGTCTATLAGPGGETSVSC